MVDTNSSSMKSGPSPNVNSDGSVDFDSYMENLQQSIKRAWFPPKTNESKSTVVRFKINEDGQLFGLRLHKPSGDAASDAAALRAVKNAAPFQPLPAGAEGPVDIEFSFDYNLFRSSSNLGNRSNGAASFENSFAIGNVKKFAPGSFPELRSDEPLLKSINPYRY
jgi:TonB family protein